MCTERGYQSLCSSVLISEILLAELTGVTHFSSRSQDVLVQLLLDAQMGLHKRKQSIMVSPRKFIFQLGHIENRGTQGSVRNPEHLAQARGGEQLDKGFKKW